MERKTQFMREHNEAMPAPGWVKDVVIAAGDSVDVLDNMTAAQAYEYASKNYLKNGLKVCAHVCASLLSLWHARRMLAASGARC